MNSPKHTLNTQDFKSIGITLLFVAVSAIVAQLLVIIPFLDLGKNTDLITVILIAVCKSVQKFIQGQEVNQESSTVVPSVVPPVPTEQSVA